MAYRNDEGEDRFSDDHFHNVLEILLEHHVLLIDKQRFH